MSYECPKVRELEHANRLIAELRKSLDITEKIIRETPPARPVVWVKWYGVTGLYERCQEDGLWGIWASHGDSGMPLKSWEKYLADVVEVREWKPPPPAVCPVTGKFCFDPAYERRID